MTIILWIIGWIALCAIVIAGWVWFVKRGRSEEWERLDRDAEASHWRRMRQSDYRGDKVQ